MSDFTSMADRNAIEEAMTWAERGLPTSVYGLLSRTTEKFGARNAVSFQILSGPTDKAETLTWSDLHGKVTQAANMFRALGIGDTDVVAYLLPNANETVITLLGGTVAGISNPINPLLDAEQIGAILRETGAKVLVTLKPFPKSDVAQKAAEAVRLAPNVQTVLEVDLNRYLTPPKSWIVPFIRPKNPVQHSAKVLDFNVELAKHNTTLDFDDATVDRACAYFHTGGTTGMPKVAQHRFSGMNYNGWLGQDLLFDEESVVICPLPLFHVFACNVILMSMVASGGHVVFPTPQGYRGDGVFDNFWKLIERWNVTFIITVPTAISAMMQRPVNADISSVRTAFSGSAPLPVELYKRFEKASGVEIIEGYGLTEATCLVSCNPIGGVKKVGSVGIPFPYTDVRIFEATSDGVSESGVDDIGEICVANPGVVMGGTYTEAAKNQGLYHEFGGKSYLRTGDLGRLDAEGYLWITGRAKDLIIRGGHNIDPAEIEEALAGHDAVAMAGAIGQPDAHAGEVPAVYVELVQGAKVSEKELYDYAIERIAERAAYPKHIEILDELPKTAVGKVFKPDLRRLAIARVFDASLAEAGQGAKVDKVVEDKRRGLVARIARTGEADDAKVAEVLGAFAVAWEWEA
ncbi:acyl-CoA synthetase [Boseongicola aestuarii]|uniref:Long-chain-fatty-acid--CoA ligase n=1 Tax=Boseongicola aestuarii TaxID=1470561 RepID=A0A238J4H7_9RHOB|nr:acyl-CoA synthetase [Boseongicola aestuarii]SMX25253.1 Long-chain-fatty-acid--CoA ligase [Boseongicola aestuarii]